MVLPPTPDDTPMSSATSDRDFFAPLGHGKLGDLTSSHHHHAHHSVDYFTGDLGGSFVPGAPEGLCEGFIKPEIPFKCGMTLSHDSPLTPFHLDSTPLTPQSSHYSGSSPLSHVSMSASPEPPLFPHGSQPSLPPHASVLHCSIASPALTTTPTSVCSSAHLPTYHNHMGTTIVLAQGHSGSNDLDIVRSLDLIGGAHHMMTESYYAHPSLSPPSVPPGHASSDSSCSGSPVRVPSFDQYEFELLQLMSNPDDLLADPKILHSSPAPTPIH